MRDQTDGSFYIKGKVGSSRRRHSTKINSGSFIMSEKDPESMEDVAEKSDKSFAEIYERDRASGAFIMNIAIEKYADVFNKLDPAPFRKRDLDQDLLDFLENCSSDIPLKYGITLHFRVLNEMRDFEKEEKIRQGLRTYFSFVRNLLQRKLRRSHKKIILDVVASLILLSFSLSLPTILSDSVVFTTLVEILNIGGWVFLWEAISTFSFRNRDIQNQYKHYKRLNKAQIIFETAQKS